MAARRIKAPYDPEAEQYLRALNRKEFGLGARRYFRFPDGRLGSMPKNGLSIRVELDDPYTANTYLNQIREMHEKYEIRNGNLVLTDRGRELKEQERLEREFKKTQPPEWYDAEYFEPEKSGKYKCVIERGIFRKRDEELDIYYKTELHGVYGKWLKPFGAKIVKWLDKPL